MLKLHNYRNNCCNNACTIDLCKDSRVRYCQQQIIHKLSSSVAPSACSSPGSLTNKMLQLKISCVFLRVSPSPTTQIVFGRTKKEALVERECRG